MDTYVVHIYMPFHTYIYIYIYWHTCTEAVIAVWMMTYSRLLSQSLAKYTNSHMRRERERERKMLVLILKKNLTRHGWFIFALTASHRISHVNVWCKLCIDQDYGIGTVELTDISYSFNFRWKKIVSQLVKRKFNKYNVWLNLYVLVRLTNLHMKKNWKM